MKRMRLTFLSAGLLALGITALTGCGASDKEAAPDGRWLDVQVDCDGGSGAEKLVDNSGMSGLEASNHLHGTREGDMFLQDGKEPMVFTFAEPVALGNLYIWNYNAPDAAGSGIREALIEYSYDGESWSSLGKNGRVTFGEALEEESEAYGGNAANNQSSSRLPVEFGGIVAKAVRITPISNYSGNASDGYGLSEVRFFRYKIRPENGSILPAISGSPLAESVRGFGENVTNGAALTVGKNGVTAGNDPSRMWRVQSREEAMVLINLDGTYPISGLSFWNYNAPEDLESGMKEIQVEYTVSDPYSSNSDGSIDYQGGNWTVLGTYELAEGTGADALEPSLVIDLSGQDIHAQHLKITGLSNYGGDGYGLAGMTAVCGSGWAVEPARQWTGLLSTSGTFPYQYSGTGGTPGEGWLGADGIYTLNLSGADRMGSLKPDDTTLFVFSDTLMGNFNNYSGLKDQYSFGMSARSMVNHSFALLRGDSPDPRKMQFYMHTDSGYGNIIPYKDWVQELVRIDDKVYCFGLRFGSEWNALSWDLVRFPYDEKTQTVDFSEAPAVAENFDIESDVGDVAYDFSSALVDNTGRGGATPQPDGYIYIYGLKNEGSSRQAIVARVLPEEFDDASKWTFWNGGEWSPIMEESVELCGEGVVSSEYSVSYMTSGSNAGRYAMNITRGTMGTCLQIGWSDSLTGIFDDFTSIYCCTEVYDYPARNKDTGIYAYNAKAHPNLSAEGELLISYNLNSFNFNWDLSHQYLHPHFVTYFEIP